MPSLLPYDQEPSRTRLVELRRELHRHPEIGFSERRTGAYIAELMRSAGLEVRPMATTGLLATLQGDRPGPTTLVRAELDALPIHET